MHNIHFCVCKADSAEEAADIVETEIADWGNENNWRHVVGVIGEDGTNMPFTTKKAFKYFVLDGTETPQVLSRMIVEAAAPTAYQREDAREAISHLNFEDSEISLPELEALLLREFADTLYHQAKMPKDFNILEHDFREWQLDEYGVTQLRDANPEGKMRYIVVIDMHS